IAYRETVQGVAEHAHEFRHSFGGKHLAADCTFRVEPLEPGWIADDESAVLLRLSGNVFVSALPGAKKTLAEPEGTRRTRASALEKASAAEDEGAIPSWVLEAICDGVLGSFSRGAILSYPLFGVKVTLTACQVLADSSATAFRLCTLNGLAMALKQAS